MNLCVTEELRGGNECFYRLPAAAVDTENWKALVETKTRVSSKADEEAKKKADEAAAKAATAANV